VEEEEGAAAGESVKMEKDDEGLEALTALEEAEAALGASEKIAKPD
jgi:hypothetical protein